MVSIFVAYHIYSREIYDISIWAYVFIVIWIVIIVKQYYTETKEYGKNTWNYVSSFIPNIHI
jgi:predicted metalloenzyme YecM